MTTEFPTVPITELFRLKQGTYLKADEMEEAPSAAFPYPVYGANGVIGYANRKMYSERTTLISCRGANCGVVHFTTPNVWISNNSIACVPATKLDPTFYHYVSLNTDFGDVVTGSAQPQITITNLSSKRLIRPPLAVQHRIAGILSAYDELMENCQRRIRILEEMARALYREWFGYFRFPGHERVPRVDSPLGPIPSGWEMRAIREFGNVVTGKTPSKANPEFYGEEVPFLKTPDMHGNMFILATGDGLSFAGAQSQSNKTIPAGSICVSCIGTIGVVCLTTEDCQTNQQINSVVLNDEETREFLFLRLQDAKQTLENLGSTGATMGNVNKGKFEAVEFLTPTKELLGRYHRLVAPMFAQILALTRKIQNLRRTRDLLLPRLLSGQVSLDVSAVEDVAEPTAPAPRTERMGSAAFQAAAAGILPDASTTTRTRPSPQTVRQDAEPGALEARAPLFSPDSDDATTLRVAEEPPAPIDQIDRTAVLQLIRQVFSEGPPRERDAAIRDVARALGYRRTGARIREILHTDLRTAVRRGILENTGGTLRLLARSITDYERDFLKQQFLAAIGRPWIARDTATRDFCRWLGFARTGPLIEDTARSLIHGLLREGRLEASGAELIRRV